MHLTLVTGQVAESPVGGNGSQSDPYQISTLENLYWMATNRDSLHLNFVLVNDIDAKETENWLILGTPGFLPIGGNPTAFSGTFDGQNYTISNLYINRYFIHQGFFGRASHATIKNLYLRNVDITASEGTGALIGSGFLSNVSNCHVSGRVQGQRHVGGLIGEDISPQITDCSAFMEIVGYAKVGGIIGQADDGPSLIKDCTFKGSIDSITYNSISVPHMFGGIAGYCEGDIVRCCTDVQINAGYWVGGICGFIWGGASFDFKDISECSSRGNINGLYGVGGIVGRLGVRSSSHNTTSNCYSEANIRGEYNVGGIAGRNVDQIRNCYFSGTATGDYLIGGIAGQNYTLPYSEVNSSIFNINTNPGLKVTGDDGVVINSKAATTSEMKESATYLDIGWDLDSIWTISEGQAYPDLINSQCSFDLPNQLIPPYCSVKGVNSNKCHIRKVYAFNGNMFNFSGNDGGYGDYIHKDIYNASANTFWLQMEGRTQAGRQKVYWRAWVDWNDNRVFESGEKVFQGTSIYQLVKTVTIPSGTAQGPKRLRIAAGLGGYPDSCESPIYGEVEDYTLQVGHSNQQASISKPIFNELINADMGRIYPNPFFDHLRLEWQDNTRLDIEVRLVNGKIYYSGSIERSDNGSIDINTTHWPNGLYFICIYGNDYVRTFSVVKN